MSKGDLAASVDLSSNAAPINKEKSTSHTEVLMRSSIANASARLGTIGFDPMFGQDWLELRGKYRSARSLIYGLY